MTGRKVLRYFAIIVFCTLIGSCRDDNNPLTDSNKAAGSIMGVVTDFATGDPVANANVSLRPGGETTLTGSDGRFEFLDIKDGDYSLTVSKAEYTELIDDYVIQVRNGKRMRRDVQIKKLPTSLAITDMAGSPLSVLDFGADSWTMSKSFNIFNNGTVPVRCSLVYSCSWIASVSTLPEIIQSGSTVPVTVTIDRNRLPEGRSSSVITISTNNGSAELTVTATSAGGNPPQVSIQPVSEDALSETSALIQGVVSNAYGAKVTDCGFYISIRNNPTENDRIVRAAASQSSFSHTITGLEPGTTYYCRAFATTNLGTGLSPEIAFTTRAGMAECGATSISNIGSTTAKATSSASAPNGVKITETGFCWTSANADPTIAGNRISASFGTGTFSQYLYPLQPSTTYRVRAYAISEYGTAYGPVVTFTTTSPETIF